VIVMAVIVIRDDIWGVVLQFAVYVMAVLAGLGLWSLVGRWRRER